MQKVQAVPQKEKEAPPRRVSETDPEARIMKQGDGGFAPSHNLQISTDAAHGIIVGVGVTQAGSDQRELMPALEEIESNLGRLPKQVVADGGFTTQETVLATAERGVELIGGAMEAGAQAARERNFERRGIAPQFRPEAFVYEAASNTYTCPAGQVLAYRGQEERVGVVRHRYQAAAGDCRPVLCGRSAVPRLPGDGGWCARKRYRRWRPSWPRCRRRRHARFIGGAVRWPSLATCG